jgi:GNAT superfamily N-acetyltransferase
MLPDGTWMRPIAPADKALLQSGVGRLSPETAYRRFLTAKPRLSPAELRYLTEVDGRDHIALVVLDDCGDLVAVGRLVRNDERPDTAELAIVVADCWQRRGLGRTLAAALTGRMDGITRVSGTMLASNRAALGLMRTIGPLEQAAFAGGVREVVARIAAPAALKHDAVAPMLLV